MKAILNQYLEEIVPSEFVNFEFLFSGLGTFCDNFTLLEDIPENIEGAKFVLGECWCSELALEEIPKEDLVNSVARHACGDWGKIGKHDREINDLCLLIEEPVMSCFEASNGIIFLVETNPEYLYTEVFLLREI